MCNVMDIMTDTHEEGKTDAVGRREILILSPSLKRTIPTVFLKPVFLSYRAKDAFDR